MRVSWLAVLLVSGAALGQSAPEKKFAAVDVHPAPYRNDRFANGGVLRGDRYIWHQATLVDLIAAAYEVDAAMVQGGPAWLEWDHYELTGLTDARTKKDDLRLMLQAALADRFGLKMHQGEKAMPAYALTAGKDAAAKLKVSDGDGTESCQFVEPPKDVRNFPITFHCSHMTMAGFARQLRDWDGGYIDKPVVDKTGLTEAYDFDFKWHPRPTKDKLGEDGISIPEGLEKELGLKLAMETSPQKVWLVDAAVHPGENGPEVAAKLPTPPPAVFEVATIKPSAPDEKGFARINGNQVNTQAIPLQFLVQFAWDMNFNSSDELVNAPKWLNEDKFDILAKVSADGVVKSGPQNESIDMEDLRAMVKQLIVERFAMKYHMEDRPLSGYTLHAGSVKMKKADPTERTKCFEGPGPDGKDPRKDNPILNRLVTCQNMTTAQIAAELEHVANGYVYGPVLDKTGLTDAYDFTLSFSSADKTLGAVPSSPKEGAADAADPSAGVTLYDAVNRQLGIKMVKEKRPTMVVVIDSMVEKPVEN